MLIQFQLKLDFRIKIYPLPPECHKVTCHKVTKPIKRRSKATNKQLKAME